MRSLLEKQARDIRVYDLRGLSGITDFTVICSGSSGPHLKALMSSVQAAIKKEMAATLPRRGGDPDSGWIVIDLIDTIIHIFEPELREYYAIEALWASAPVRLVEEA